MPKSVLGGAKVHSSATGPPQYSQVMPCDPASARRARHLVVSALNTWKLAQLADDATLAMSELVANAVMHSNSRTIRVIITRTGPLRVRVTVADKSRTQPTPRAAMPCEEAGRGLAVVDEIADRWGSDPLPWGKHMWAELGPGPEGTLPS